MGRKELSPKQTDFIPADPVMQALLIGVVTGRHMKTDWLKKQTEKAQVELYLLLYKESLKKQGIAKYKWPWFLETEDALAKLPVWQRTSTTLKAEAVSETEAAILPKSLIYDDELPYVDGWNKILAAIAKGRHLHVKSLLRDVTFLHHQSTNGRWNNDLGRFERWGVRSVEEWRMINGPMVSESTWRRIKSELVTLKLIVSKPYLWHDKPHVWIKPTEELSRIMFDPGYWETVKDKYVLAPKPKKARGISAICKEIEAEQAALYKQVINYQLQITAKPHAWEIWDKLTKPIALGKKYTKQPFALKGSKRWKRLYEALGLGML